MFFFFKQKTAYEMRISDWSSDVCSSDLPAPTDSTDDLDDLVRTEAVTVIPNDQLVDGICHGALHHDLHLSGVGVDRVPHQLSEAEDRLAPDHSAAVVIRCFDLSAGHGVDRKSGG